MNPAVSFHQKCDIFGYPHFFFLSQQLFVVFFVTFFATKKSGCICTERPCTFSSLIRKYRIRTKIIDRTNVRPFQDFSGSSVICTNTVYETPFGACPSVFFSFVFNKTLFFCVRLSKMRVWHIFFKVLFYLRHLASPNSNGCQSLIPITFPQDASVPH